MQPRRLERPQLNRNQEKSMRGIRKYGKRFRAYVVDAEGRQHQKYFNSEKQAEDFIREHRPEKQGNGRYKKRANSRKSDLPVGLSQTVKRKKLSSGVGTYDAIVATVVINGKPKTKSATFGENRTREEAVQICLAWRLEQLKNIAQKQ